jgi:hypothetical protein
MDYSYGSRNQKGGNGIPLWLFILLCTVIFSMALAAAFFVLLHFKVIQCGPNSSSETKNVETSAPDPDEEQRSDNPEQQPDDPEQPGNTDPEYIDPDDPDYEKDPEEPEEQPSTPEPIVVAPSEAPTPEPIEVQTPEPTEAPTQAPTEKPDTFLFGGKTIKRGEKKISGKKLGINGKSKKPRHITKEEVQDLVELCPDLEELELEYCSLEDYSPIGNLTKLRKLAFTYCGTGDGNAITDIDWLENLTELRRLNLSHNKIDDTEALSGLKKLTYLNLAGNPLTDEDLEPLSNLTNLETLYLYDLKKVTDVTPLSKLSKLTFLHIGRNSKLKNVKPLTKLKKLTQLRLNHTKVSDLSYFKNFSALKKLDLGKCPIPEEQFYNLKGCKKLTKIVLEMSDEEAFYAIVEMINEGYDFHVLYNWSE